MPILSQLVDDWIAGYQSRLDNELDYFVRIPTDGQAIMLAAKGRGENNVKLDHQRRLSLVSLDTFSDQLVLDSRFWPTFLAFSSLFKRIQLTANKVYGVGDLAVYDTALRIGWRFGLKPSEVYLQSGARDGAKRLLKIPRGCRSVPVSLFPKQLHSLAPYRIENFLYVSAKNLDQKSAGTN